MRNQLVRAILVCLEPVRHHDGIRSIFITPCYCNGSFEVQGQPQTRITRPVGYYRPVSRWNKGKQAEYTDRVVFSGCGETA